MRQDETPKLQRLPVPAVKNLQADELFDSICTSFVTQCGKPTTDTRRKPLQSVK
jgi:hypothetical protein